MGDYSAKLFAQALSSYTCEIFFEQHVRLFFLSGSLVVQIQTPAYNNVLSYQLLAILTGQHVRYFKSRGIR